MTSPAADTRKPPLAPKPEPTPVAYVILTTLTTCSGCCGWTRSDQIMLRCDTPPTFGMGKPVTQLTALRGAPQYNLPIERRQGTPQQIPFCSACSQPERAVQSLPTPPQTDHRVLKPAPHLYGLANSAAAMERNAKATAGGGSRTTGPARPKKSTDELLDLL